MHVLPGVGSNSSGHLDDMRLDEKKNLGLSLNEKKKPMGLFQVEVTRRHISTQNQESFLADGAIQLWKGLIKTK